MKFLLSLISDTNVNATRSTYLKFIFYDWHKIEFSNYQALNCLRDKFFYFFSSGSVMFFRIKDKL